MWHLSPERLSKELESIAIILKTVSIRNTDFGDFFIDMSFKCRLNLGERNQKNLEKEAQHQGET